ncbi:unnamed protein product [Dracunculus medinensis]|uniref:Afadin n=1 Tax=Dracunculus medinensis TaxID=318479 RepID=A0A0N4U938_DRAME|nr:unnamed protein product [Dracunculus medinensis]
MIYAPTSRAIEREQLIRLVEQWNENRLDLFSLSYPNEDLEIHGVMRFYFQESKTKVSTKCIRVSSTATTRAVIEALVDKFHPDLKMLSNPEYTIWEVHENGEERLLTPEEKPLLVQLNWHKDDREGRFLLRQQSCVTIPFMALQVGNAENMDNMHRNNKRFSKREKKELKKKYQQALPLESENAACELYKAIPPTTFTRTLSNPEIVMKKRRERKIEAKLKGMGQGGSLKIYGYDLVPSRPYVTLLVSVRDQACKIVKETLEKYGLEKENCDDYILVEISLPASGKLTRSLSDLRDINDGRHERYLNDDELPLIYLADHAGDASKEIMFAVRKRPSNIPTIRRFHGSLSSTNFAFGVSKDSVALSSDFHSLSSENSLLRAVSPCLVHLTPDGKELASYLPILIGPFVTDIGGDHSMKIHLTGEQIRPRHAVINFSNGIVTITPSVLNAEIEVNNQRISQTVMLRDGDIVCIGRIYNFQYYNSQVIF